MFKLIVGFSFIIFSIACVQAKPARTISSTNIKVAEGKLKKFIEVTKIDQGYYSFVKGNDECMEGDLSVIEVDDSLSVLLGAKALVIGLGVEAYAVKERECESKVSSKFSSGYIYGRSVEVCKSLGSTIYETTLSFKGTKLTYEQKITSKEGVKKTTCYLVKEQ